MIGMIYRELLNMEIWNSRQTDDDADEECEINFNVRASAKNFWNVLDRTDTELGLKGPG